MKGDDGIYGVAKYISTKNEITFLLRDVHAEFNLYIMVNANLKYLEKKEPFYVS